jgi:hypothetical protein
MLIQGFPVSSSLLRDSDAADRFWYWRGKSGRRYIHSVYSVATCPPLPGAVYVAVKRTGALRTALSVDRFPSVLDDRAGAKLRARIAACGAEEVHVHLLAGSEIEAETIRADLSNGFAAEDGARQTELAA